MKVKSKKAVRAVAQWVGAIGCTVLAIFAAEVIVSSLITNGHKPPGKSAPPHGVCSDACSLIIEPDDGIAPMRTMVRGALNSIDLVMYELEDKAIDADLITAAKRGVAVRVLLSPGYEGEPSAINEGAFETLSANGVLVRWSPGYFALTHEKSLVVDDATALVMSFNLVPKYYPTGRDFGVVDRDARDVAAMEDAFNTDWQGNDAPAPAGDNLVWSPGSRTAIIAMINDASASLDIYNEEMADDGVVSALVSAARRGVAVRIDMTYSRNWKSAFTVLADANVDIRTYGASAPFYIHAKMIITDGVRAFVGSENFSETSLDKNRELGVMVSNQDIIQSLEAVFETDWEGAKVLERPK